MHAKGLTACFAGLLVFAVAAPLWSQSLADVAKKEEERRKQTPATGKTYTNKDLGSVPPATAPPPPAPTGDASSAAAKDGAKAGEKAGEKAGDAAKGDDKASGSSGGKQDQTFWSNKMKGLREAVDRDQTLADAMQSRINGLTTDFTNRDDPAQRAVIEKDRQRAISELERLKKQVVADKKAITDAEEEARKAGVPAGWLR